MKFTLKCNNVSKKIKFLTAFEISDTLNMHIQQFEINFNEKKVKRVNNLIQNNFETNYQGTQLPNLKIN